MWYIFTQEKADKSCWYRNISIEADTKEEALNTYREFLKRNSFPFDRESLLVREDEYGHSDKIDIDAMDLEGEAYL